MQETFAFAAEQALRILGFYPVVLKGLWMTLGLSALGIAIGLVVGFAFGVGRAGAPRALALLIGTYIDLFRGTPVLVQLFVVYFILPAVGVELGAFAAGVITLANITACFVGEIVCAAIRAVPRGQIEAAAASGLTASQCLWLIVLPQATRMVVPSLVGQSVLLVKDSSVVSAIGLLDLTRSGWIIVQSVPNGLLVFALIGLGYFAICYPLLGWSRVLEKRVGH
ncbi:MAG: amino acid ABC transporter permease [Rhodoferax sp.]